MAMASHCLSSARFLTVGGTRSIPLQRKPLLFSVTLSSRSQNLHSSIVTASSKKKNKKKLTHVTEETQEEVDEDDPFEMFFNLLEEELKKDDLSPDDIGDEITEEDMDSFERELDGVLEDFDDDAEKTSKDESDNSLNLRSWQLNKLARALKTGRRKTSIKALAAELCLDRYLVLELLRNPPPNLLMMSLSIPDEPTPSAISTPGENFYQETSAESADHAESEPKSDVPIPIHTMQENWSSRKRLKKAHLDTLEKVYMKSKRPTNSMISNIVHVTNIPRRTIIKWFEDKRAEDGVPERRLPHQHSAPKTG